MMVQVLITVLILILQFYYCILSSLFLLSLSVSSRFVSSHENFDKDCFPHGSVGGKHSEALNA